MSNIKLPVLYAKLLENSELEPVVKDAVNKCTQFYGDLTRTLTFFPEYTEHGVSHVQRVLNSTAYVIGQNSERLLTKEDAAVLVIATLLHDSGMHLTEDGFLTLVTSQDYVQLFPDIDRHSWGAEWRQYFAEATHWNDRQLRRVLCDHAHHELKPAEDLAACIRPLEEMLNPEQWTLGYRRFIGEFIRRHHARLAHEFALVGVPGPASHARLRLVALNDELADLAGLVARSHNMHLRETFGYLEEHFQGQIVCRGCHPVFLMGILRIADYLDVGPDRTPTASQQVRSIRHPVSRAEWSVNLCIKEVRADEKDREAVFVVASPEGSRIYLKLRDLLDSLQSELDQTWAVVGEVYSRQDELRDFGLRLRRIRSNLDDLSRFRRNVTYIPSQFAFDTAGAELLKKLVIPLYGDHPEVGIRELLQNAIDAVNELQCSGIYSQASIGDQPTITIRVERDADGECMVCVEDYGIGMDEAILRSYFFRAGA